MFFNFLCLVLFQVSSDECQKERSPSSAELQISVGEHWFIGLNVNERAQFGILDGQSAMGFK